jgi:hypothetical protein
MESVAKFGQPPRGDDLKRGIEGLEREFEAQLIIAFECLIPSIWDSKLILTISTNIRARGIDS